MPLGHISPPLTADRRVVPAYYALRDARLAKYGAVRYLSSFPPGHAALPVLFRLAVEALTMPAGQTPSAHSPVTLISSRTSRRNCRCNCTARYLPTYHPAACSQSSSRPTSMQRTLRPAHATCSRPSSAASPTCCRMLGLHSRRRGPLFRSRLSHPRLHRSPAVHSKIMVKDAAYPNVCRIHVSTR